MTEKIRITTDDGMPVEAQAPVIVSAARSTDIPAFYARWFINRLKAGYVIWYNPFNRKPAYVSFRNTRVVVFWTKNPEPLLPFLRELDERGIHCYFNFTLNDYEREGFEPDVPPLTERIETFRRLSGLIGKEKVIWRFDPLIITPQCAPRDLLEKIRHTGNRLKGCTDKLVFSFVDINAYRCVRRNLAKATALFSTANAGDAEFTGKQMTETAEGLAKIRDCWKSEGWDISLATCAEQIDLSRYGIEHNRCIDGELMRRLFADDAELIRYLSRRGKLPGNALPKDRGQRKACGCTASKDIGMYNTCRHFCLYCYANTSRPAVEENIKSHHENGENILS
jgi:hypothetical protein